MKRWLLAWFAGALLVVGGLMANPSPVAATPPTSTCDGDSYDSATHRLEQDGSGNYVLQTYLCTSTNLLNPNHPDAVAHRNDANFKPSTNFAWVRLNKPSAPLDTRQNPDGTQQRPDGIVADGARYVAYYAPPARNTDPEVRELLRAYDAGEITESEFHARLRRLSVSGSTPIPARLLLGDPDSYSFPGQNGTCGGDRQPPLSGDQLEDRLSWACNTRLGEWILIQQPPSGPPLYIFSQYEQLAQDPDNPNICDPKVSFTVPTNIQIYGGQTFTVRNLNYDPDACRQRHRAQQAAERERLIQERRALWADPANLPAGSCRLVYTEETRGQTVGRLTEIFHIIPNPDSGLFEYHVVARIFDDEQAVADFLDTYDCSSPTRN